MANVVEFSLKATNQYSSQFASFRSSISGVVKVAAGLGAAVAASAVIAGKALVDVGSTTENLRIRMNAMLGDVGEGNKVFKDMTQFASEVPFAYEEIMGAATQLSGILKGGSKEIAATMPMIADLAAVSGLSIEKTTEQVTRLFSAGAGSADLFRERGINAMLGFEAGVAVTAEESKQRLIEAFEDPSSKFRGAAAKMATTWDGVLSMIGDKWFAMKSEIADSGLFNYIKSIALAFNDLMGQALDNTRENAVSWSNSVIDGLRFVMDAVGALADVYRGLEAVWIVLKLSFAKFAEETIRMIFNIVDGWRQLANVIPGIDLGPLDTMNEVLTSIQNTTAGIRSEFSDLADLPMPSEAVESFALSVETTFTKLQDMTAIANAAIVDQSKLAANQQTMLLEEQKTAYDTFLADMGLSNETYGEQFTSLMGSAVQSVSDGIATAIVDGKNMAEVFKAVAKNVLKDLISLLVKMGIQRLLFSAITKGALTSEGASQGALAVGTAAANGVASMALAPFPLNLGAPAFGAAMGAAAAGAFGAGAATGATLGAVAGAAHGGLTNVPSESTFLLQKGERVLSPNQNKDFTDFIGGGSGGGGSSIEIGSITINTKAESFADIDDEELIDFIAGRLIPAQDKLSSNGVRLADLEEGNI